ncbi:MAG: hypothetical protein ACLRZ9_00215 [Eubacterium sp.]
MTREEHIDPLTVELVKKEIRKSNVVADELFNESLDAVKEIGIYRA